MFILSPKTMPNGSAGVAHYIDQLTVTAGGAVATITSKLEADGQVCWQERIDIPYEALTADPMAAAVAYLTAQGGYLAGGELVSDPTALELVRADMLARIARERDALLIGGCATPSGVIDTDMVSRSNITGTVAMAMLAKSSGAPFSTLWRMRDNSSVALNADAMIAVGVTVGMFVASVYATSFQFKDAVRSAEDLDALAAIDLSWPQLAASEAEGEAE
jgi:hypothetical protein